MHTISKNQITFRINLPKSFCIQSIFDFYQRDSAQLTEHVDLQKKILYKGILHHGQPTKLSLKFMSTSVIATFKTQWPQRNLPTMQNLERQVRQMLGLSQPIEEFEHLYFSHREIGFLIKKQKGLRILLAATPFEALSWAIMSQQIHLKAAIAIRSKLIKLIDKTYNPKLWCYPDATSLAPIPIEKLQNIGLTKAKMNTLLKVSQTIKTNDSENSLHDIYECLLNFSGIGPWTARYTLLRGFGYLDSSLHQDSGVRRALQHLQHLPQKPSVGETQEWLSQFSPWRSLVVAHLWEFLKTL